jgi:hypothetical protein
VADYQSLSAEDRAAVDRGEIREGMNTNGVFIAWGAPTRILINDGTVGLETTWAYYEHWTRKRPRWVLRYSPSGWVTYDYQPELTSLKYLAKTVVFRDERAVRWQRFPPPID